MMRGTCTARPSLLPPCGRRQIKRRGPWRMKTWTQWSASGPCCRPCRSWRGDTETWVSACCSSDVPAAQKLCPSPALSSFSTHLLDPPGPPVSLAPPRSSPP